MVACECTQLSWCKRVLTAAHCLLSPLCACMCRQATQAQQLCTHIAHTPCNTPHSQSRPETHSRALHLAHTGSTRSTTLHESSALACSSASPMLQLTALARHQLRQQDACRNWERNSDDCMTHQRKAQCTVTFVHSFMPTKQLRNSRSALLERMMLPVMQHCHKANNSFTK